MDENAKTPPEGTEKAFAWANRWPMHRRKWLVLVAFALIAVFAFPGVIPLEVRRDYAGTGKNILGWSCSFQHARPHVGPVIMTRAWLDPYVDTLDAAGKLELYRLLASGGREAIRAEEKEIETVLERT